MSGHQAAEGTDKTMENTKYTLTNGWDDTFSESYNSFEEAMADLKAWKESDLDYWATEYPDETIEAKYTIIDPDGEEVYIERVVA